MFIRGMFGVYSRDGTTEGIEVIFKPLGSLDGEAASPKRIVRALGD